MWKSDEYYLEKAIEVSRKSRAGGNTPFGCVLVDGDGEIILEQGNVEITEKRCTGHAETVIMERASKLYDKKSRRPRNYFRYRRGQGGNSCL